MEPLRVAGLCAVGLLLLFCAASSQLESAQGDGNGLTQPEIVVNEPVHADQTFYIKLLVIKFSTSFYYAIGHLLVDNVEVIPSELTPEYGGGFGIPFYDDKWESPLIDMSPLSAGEHTLYFRVEYSLDSGEGYDDFTVHLTLSPSYTVVWLQRPEPYEQIRAGKMIRFRFSIQDASGKFVQSNDVRIEVKEDATGKLVPTGGSIRINTNREYYRWYWKTDSNLPAGVYSVIVLLDSAEVGRTSITIVSKN